MFESLNNYLRLEIESTLNTIKAEWLNKNVVIPIGKFKGRKGRVTQIVFFDWGGISIQMQPYKLQRRGQTTHILNELLWEPNDARRWWPVSRFEALEIWSEN